MGFRIQVGSGWSELTVTYRFNTWGLKMIKKIGILRGRENNFPNALMEAINHKGKGDVVAEMATMGAGRVGDPLGYDLIYDRISHDYPYYRYLLKAEVARGTYVIPNPLLWSADDKYIGFTLAASMGLTIPKTCLLPIAGSTRLYDITAESLRNLKFLDHSEWQGIFDYIGFPCWLKPGSGGGWLAVSKVHSPDEFFHLYNNEIFHTKPVYPENAGQDAAVRNWLSRTLVFMLQEDIAYQQFARCFYIAGDVTTARFEPPDRVAGERLGHYSVDPDFFGPELLARIEGYVRDLNQGLGYEINTTELLVKDGIPYAIDFLNFACDFDIDSVGAHLAGVGVDKVSDYLIECVTDETARLQSKDNDWHRLIRGRFK
jgi:hypothetical protein